MLSNTGQIQKKTWENRTHSRSRAVESSFAISWQFSRPVAAIVFNLSTDTRFARRVSSAAIAKGWEIKIIAACRKTALPGETVGKRGRRKYGYTPVDTMVLKIVASLKPFISAIRMSMRMTPGVSHSSLSSAFGPLSARIDNTVGLKYVIAGFDRLGSGRGPVKVQRGWVQRPFDESDGVRHLDAVAGLVRRPTENQDT